MTKMTMTTKMSETRKIKATVATMITRIDDDNDSYSDEGDDYDDDDVDSDLIMFPSTLDLVLFDLIRSFFLLPVQSSVCLTVCVFVCPCLFTCITRLCIDYYLPLIFIGSLILQLLFVVFLCRLNCRRWHSALWGSIAQRHCRILARCRSDVIRTLCCVHTDTNVRVHCTHAITNKTCDNKQDFHLYMMREKTNTIFGQNSIFCIHFWFSLCDAKLLGATSCNSTLHDAMLHVGYAIHQHYMMRHCASYATLCDHCARCCQSNGVTSSRRDVIWAIWYFSCRSIVSLYNIVHSL